ncbi:MAG: DUF1272 domain-containing protein [Rubrivivax sp.]
MLELRPGCEHCDRDLPPVAAEARICSYECTFCATCVEQVLFNTCPNCGGGFTARPVRPAQDRVGGNFLGRHPASVQRRHKPVDPLIHKALRDALGALAPEQR